MEEEIKTEEATGDIQEEKMEGEMGSPEVVNQT